MLQTRVDIIHVDSTTLQICGQLGATGCMCTCSSCLGCTDCTNCPNLTIANINMQVYRTGANLPATSPPTPPPYFVLYPAYTLIGTTVCFFIDNKLNTLTGQYTGDVYVNNLICGSIQMDVRNVCGIWRPFAVSSSGRVGNDLQP